MILTIKYDRINFFGNREYTEDKTSFVTKKNVTRAFTFLSKEKDAAIDIYDNEAVILYWDTYKDFANRIITVKNIRSRNDSDITQVAFEKAKKMIYSKIGG